MKSAVAAGVVLAGLFLGLGALVAGAPPAIDRALARTLGGQWQHTPGTVADVISHLLGPTLPYVFSVLLLGFAVIGWRRGRRGTAWLLVRCLVLLWVCRAVSVCKEVYHRARPRPIPEYAYPSGHVVSVTAVAFVSVIACAWLFRGALRWVAAVSVVAVVLTAVSRMVLDVHWFTDVVGGVLGVVGVGLLTAAALRLLPVREDPGVTSIS